MRSTNKYPLLHATRRYLREQWLLHRARVWVRQRGIAIAALAMFRLNHHAQTMRYRSPVKDSIYLVKNEFVKFLYTRGYCISARQQEQTLRCRTCGGTGIFDEEYDEECRRCGGTGIYSQFLLYSFRFKVGDRVYSWHQPEQLVDWDVMLTEPELGQFQERENLRRHLPEERMMLLLCAVYVFLVAHGVSTLPRTLRLRDALYTDLIAIPRQRIQQQWDSLLDLVWEWRESLRLAPARKRANDPAAYDYETYLEAFHGIRDETTDMPVTQDDDDLPF